VIFDVLGTPDDISFITDEKARNYIKSFGKIEKKPFNKIFDFMPPEVEDFLEQSLKFNPSQRLTIKEALKHPLFDEVRGEFEENVNVVGSPVDTDIERLTFKEIKERVVQEYEYFQKMNLMGH
jgi:serine/threonine protein kinase